MSKRDAHVAIIGLIEAYLEGLYQGDTQLLAEVFHPKAHYVTASGPEFVIHDMPAYFEIVAKRVPPRERGEARNGEIVTLEFAGPVTARAHVTCRFLGRTFNDFLTFVKTEDRWRIISKVFHYVEE